MAVISKRDLLDVAGGAAAGTIDGVLKGIFNKDPAYWTGRFPYISAPIDSPLYIIPSLDDWLVLVGSGLVWFAGRSIRNADLTYIGLKAMVSSIGMLADAVVERARTYASRLAYISRQAAKPAAPSAPKPVAAAPVITPTRVSTY